MSKHRLRESTRQFLLDRLDRLNRALENLGSRLRESIAQIVGTEVGEAIREVVESALNPQTPRPSDRFPPRYQRYDDERRGALHDDYEDDFWRESDSVLEQPEPRQNSSWRSLLAGAIELAIWWLQSRPAGSKWPSLPQILTVGATVGFALFLAGPMVGGLVMAAGSVLLMTRLTDGVSSAVGRMANATAR